ncbi:hypothetical protein [Pontiella desulfatans]|uniref:hypothetical protein n=1 Tax=Pontiella desulfatans TaxID=2750659 RepID=UPI001443ED52|nr:hypothetical protein [Pontiella desulfatans]
MKNEVLIELAERWEREAVTPKCQDGAPEAEMGNAVRKGQRETKRECADTLRTLVSILG